MYRSLVVAFVLLAVAPTATAAEDYATARRALSTALQAGDDASALTHARAALRSRPGYPPLQEALAGIQARLGDPHAALATLGELAKAGVVADVSEDGDFQAVRELEGYARLRQRQEALRKPAGQYRVAAHLEQPTFVPEGIAVDAGGSFYLGSIRHARIVRLDGGSAETLAADGAYGLASVFGLRLDEQAGLLWACTAVVPQGLAASAKRLGHSGILRLRMDTGELVDAHWLPDDGQRHVLGDLIVLGEQTAVATDSLGGGVYELDVRSGVFSLMIPPGRLASPQGIAFDPDRGVLFIADWSGGLFRFHRSSGALTGLKGPDGTMLYGIDGLYRHDGDLIAVQNLAVPHRVTRIQLDAEGTAVTAQRTVARALPEFDEPTLGAVRGDVLYLNANSHWNRFDSDNALPSGDSLSGPTVLAISVTE